MVSGTIPKRKLSLTPFLPRIQQFDDVLLFECERGTGPYQKLKPRMTSMRLRLPGGLVSSSFRSGQQPWPPHEGDCRGAAGGRGQGQSEQQSGDAVLEGGVAGALGAQVEFDDGHRQQTAQNADGDEHRADIAHLQTERGQGQAGEHDADAQESDAIDQQPGAQGMASVDGEVPGQGAAPGERNEDHRIRHACRLLEDPSSTLTVLEISVEPGFASLGPFNRAFKAAMGQTPSAYRACRMVPGTNGTCSGVPTASSATLEIKELR